jgi:hypothetical protein
MCIFGGLMMLNRLPGMPLGLLGNKLHHLFPDLPPASMGGQACHYLESSCAPKLCSVTGGGLGHISWVSAQLPAWPASVSFPCSRAAAGVEGRQRVSRPDC